MAEKGSAKAGLAAIVSLVGAFAAAAAAWFSAYETNHRLNAAAASAQAPPGGALLLAISNEYDVAANADDYPPSRPSSLSVLASFSWTAAGAIWIPRIHARCTARARGAPGDAAKLAYVGILTDGPGRAQDDVLTPPPDSLDLEFFDGRLGRMGGGGKLYTAEHIGDAAERDANWAATAQPTGFLQATNASDVTRPSGSVKFRLASTDFMTRGGEIGCMVVADTCPIGSIVDAELSLARAAGEWKEAPAGERVKRAARAVCEGPLMQRAWGASTLWMPSAGGPIARASEVAHAASSYASAVASVASVTKVHGAGSPAARAAALTCRALGTAYVLSARDAWLPPAVPLSSRECDPPQPTPPNVGVGGGAGTSAAGGTR